MEVETLWKIYDDTNNTIKIDDRKHSVEAQITSQISLSCATTEAIILPKQCLDYEFVKQFINGNGKGIVFIPYELNKHKSSTEYQALLEELAKEHQKSLSLI